MENKTKKGLGVSSIRELLDSLQLDFYSPYVAYNVPSSPSGFSKNRRQPNTPPTRRPTIHVNDMIRRTKARTPYGPRPTNTLRSLNTTPYLGPPTTIPTPASTNYSPAVAVNIQTGNKTKNTKNLFGHVGFFPSKTRKISRNRRRRQSRKYRKH
jgi:hypothetical protein